MTIIGSLVLHSDRPVPEFQFPELTGLQLREGHHVSSRYNGSYREYFDMDPLEIMVPQRYKRMSLLADASIRHDLADALSSLDSKYGDVTMLNKLKLMSSKLGGTWNAIVNISNGGADGQQSSGGFYLLSHKQPIYVCLVFDSNSGAVQLVWSTLYLKDLLRQQNALNYSMFDLPTIRLRPLFVPSQALCSRWWRMSKGLCQTQYGLMRAANALERTLYKNTN